MARRTHTEYSIQTRGEQPATVSERVSAAHAAAILELDGSQPDRRQSRKPVKQDLPDANDRA